MTIDPSERLTTILVAGRRERSTALQSLLERVPGTGAIVEADASSAAAQLHEHSAPAAQLHEHTAPLCVIVVHEPPAHDALAAIGAWSAQGLLRRAPVVAVVADRDQRREAARAGALACVEQRSLDEHSLREAIEDATDRFRALDVPSRDERLDRRVLESIVSFVVVLDADGTIIDSNRARLESVGLELDGELRGKKLWECPWWGRSDDVRARVRDACARAAAGELVRDDLPARTRDEHPLTVASHVAPLRDDAGRITHLVHSAVDVTQRHRAEEHLRESERRFREMADGLPLILWVHDAAGKQEMVNETFCEFFGVTREEMQGDRWQLLMHPDDAEAYTREFQAAVADRRAFHGAVRVMRHDGQWRCIESWARPRFGAGGALHGYIGTSADITERQAAEAALRASEDRFRHLADAMPQLLWIADEAGHATYYNSRHVEYEGIERTPDGTWLWQPVVHPDDIAATSTAWQASLEQGETYQCEHRIRVRGGSSRWHLSRAYRLRDHEGVARWFGTATDIHDVKEAQQALRDAARRKDEFLAMLGHELRNPLGAIRSAMHLAKLTIDDSSDLQRILGVLDRQSAHMTRLTDDLLDASRIALGKIALDRQPLALRDVLESVVLDRSAPSRERVNVAMRLSDAPLWVSGDRVRLAQVFDNLIGNAIKFTQSAGTIEVTLAKDAGDAVVRVRDTGVGIRPEMLARMFEPFEQEAQEISRASGGLGLGLAIAKGLVELHRGTIAARSAGLGSGTELEIRLPLVAPPQRERGVEPQGGARGLRILLVEDNTDAAEMLGALLGARGHDVAIASHGPEALDLLRARRTDVVLCDIGLPGMSGYEIARAIRGDSALRSVTLVALTGYGQQGDRERAREAGFDAHLVKPVDDSALQAVFDRFVELRADEASP
ncbi:MAG: PAS domain S-box protein [Myxococcota bacterium]|nr:PAS domain S-box protein [Myxococcota bacterium]